MIDCCGKCSHVHEVPPPAPCCVRALSAVCYFVTFLASFLGILAEVFGRVAMVHFSDDDAGTPLAFCVLALMWSQYVIESFIAYCPIVTLSGWKPYHVIQHHFAAVLLIAAGNVLLFQDKAVWFELWRSHRSVRLGGFSAGLTGVNEGVWVLSTFAADAKASWLEWLRICVGVTCLIQNIAISCLAGVWFSVYGLLPLYKATGSPVVLFQIALTGVFQPIVFHVYLQGWVFLRLQCKKMKRMISGTPGTPKLRDNDSDAIEILDCEANDM